MLKALCFVSLTVLSLSATGCKDITKDVDALADRACACKDKACSDKVIDDLVDLLKNNKHAGGDEDKVKASATRLATCAITAGTDPSSLTSKMSQFSE